MYPAVPKSIKLSEYRVRTRLPPKWEKIKFYSQEGVFLEEKNVQMNIFYVSLGNKTYKLATKSNGLKEGDKIQVYFENGDYKIKKVDNNV
jgi:hypothetical protein